MLTSLHLTTVILRYFIIVILFGKWTRYRSKATLETKAAIIARQTHTTAEGLQLLLDNCTKWSAEYQMAWNTVPGKSEVLLSPRGHQTSTFFLSGKPLRNVESSVYFGVSLTTSGITEEKHIWRVKAAQRCLMQLSPIGLHIRGFNTNLCVMLLWYKNPTKGNYNTDLERWPYREVDRRSNSVAVSTGVGRARRVQLLTVSRRVGLVTYLG